VGSLVFSRSRCNGRPELTIGNSAVRSPGTITARSPSPDVPLTSRPRRDYPPGGPLVTDIQTGKGPYWRDGSRRRGRSRDLRRVQVDLRRRGPGGLLTCRSVRGPDFRSRGPESLKGMGSKTRRRPEVTPRPWSYPAALVEKPPQRRTPGEAPPSLSEGNVHGPPGNVGGVRDGAGGSSRPVPRTAVVAVGPFKDLVGGQCRSFLSHGGNPFPTQAAPLTVPAALRPGRPVCFNNNPAHPRFPLLRLSSGRGVPPFYPAAGRARE
jgi:hypothetical protein